MVEQKIPGTFQLLLEGALAVVTTGITVEAIILFLSGTKFSTLETGLACGFAGAAVGLIAHLVDLTASISNQS